MKKELQIYQAKNGAIELNFESEKETVWASQKQIAEIFEVNSQAITKHIKNIYSEKELSEKQTCSKMEQVQKEGKKEVNRTIKIYNLDMMISIGYRVNSKKATQFRIWATKILKEHIAKGFTVNKKVLKNNHKEFLKAVEDIKILSKNNELLENSEILDLVKTFSATWFNLESYDKQNFPEKGKKKKTLKISFDKLGEDLYIDLGKFKKELIRKKEATELFAQEKKKKALEGILGNILQSVFGKDAYGSVEEKAAHLLYFVVKNHPFNDGNKRTGAFSFIWFLRKNKFKFAEKITPETLTTLTLLIAESKPSDKDKMIGLVLLLLGNKK